MAKFIKTEQTAKGLQVIYLNDAEAVADAQYAEFRIGGNYVNDVPPPADNGMLYQLMYNPNTDAVYYEYTTPPPSSQDEIIAALQKQVEDLNRAVAGLLGGAPA